MSIGLTMHASPWQEWGFAIDVSKGHPVGDIFVQAATKEIEIQKKPPGSQHPCIKFPFIFEKHTGIFRLKKFPGVMTGNLITMEEFFDEGKKITGPGKACERIYFITKGVVEL